MTKTSVIIACELSLEIKTKNDPSVKFVCTDVIVNLSVLGKELFDAGERTRATDGGGDLWE